MPVLAKIRDLRVQPRRLCFGSVPPKKLVTFLAALANPLRSPGTRKATVLKFEGSSGADLVIAETFKPQKLKLWCSASLTSARKARRVMRG